MAISDDIIRDRLETSLNLIPPLPGRLDPLAIPGTVGRISTISHPFTNLVAAARLDDSSVDGAIEAAFAQFTPRDVAWGWAVGPRSTPADLGERLRARGLVPVSVMDGLVLDNMDIEVPTNPAVEVEEVPLDQIGELTELAAISFDLPVPVVALLFDAYMAGGTGERSRFYSARLNGEPVSWAALTYLPGEPIALLGGASTLAEHRGKGVYRSLVARRLADAAADGMETAIIQAVKATSAPICRRLGFRYLGDITIYAFIPESGDGGVHH